MNDAKVLVVVEDEADMRFLVTAMLSRDPRISVEGEAATAEDAIELARTLQPGAIILDHFIDGPTMGADAAPALKQVAPNAKILLFTAFDMAARARQEPAIDAFLQKDDLRRLLPTVQRLLDLDPLVA